MYEDNNQYCSSIISGECVQYRSGENTPSYLCSRMSSSTSLDTWLLKVDKAICDRESVLLTTCFKAKTQSPSSLVTRRFYEVLQQYICDKNKDVLVKITGSDTTAGYLKDKLIGSECLNVTLQGQSNNRMVNIRLDFSCILNKISENLILYNKYCNILQKCFNGPTPIPVPVPVPVPTVPIPAPVPVPIPVPIPVLPIPVPVPVPAPVPIPVPTVLPLPIPIPINTENCLCVRGVIATNGQYSYTNCSGQFIAGASQANSLVCVNSLLPSTNITVLGTNLLCQCSYPPTPTPIPVPTPIQPNCNCNGVPFSIVSVTPINTPTPTPIPIPVSLGQVNFLLHEASEQDDNFFKITVTPNGNGTYTLTDIGDDQGFTVYYKINGASNPLTSKQLSSIQVPSNEEIHVLKFGFDDSTGGTINNLNDPNDLGWQLYFNGSNSRNVKQGTYIFYIS